MTRIRNGKSTIKIHFWKRGWTVCLELTVAAMATVDVGDAKLGMRSSGCIVTEKKSRSNFEILINKIWTRSRKLELSSSLPLEFGVRGVKLDEVDDGERELDEFGVCGCELGDVWFADVERACNGGAEGEGGDAGGNGIGCS